MLIIQFRSPGVAYLEMFHGLFWARQKSHRIKELSPSLLLGNLVYCHWQNSVPSAIWGVVWVGSPGYSPVQSLLYLRGTLNSIWMTPWKWCCPRQTGRRAWIVESSFAIQWLCDLGQSPLPLQPCKKKCPFQLWPSLIQWLSWGLQINKNHGLWARMIIKRASFE